MKESFWGYFLIALGVVIIIVILMIQSISVTTEEDYYLGREVLEASMYDAVDFGTYERTGKLVMSKEKFVEVFIRRFAESVTNNKINGYQLDFYDIHEYPPKATVRIRTKSETTEINSNAFAVNLDTIVNGVLVTNYGKHRLGDVNLDGMITDADYILIGGEPKNNDCGVLDTNSSSYKASYLGDRSPFRTNSVIGSKYSAEEKDLVDINRNGKIDKEDWSILCEYVRSGGTRDRNTNTMVGKDLYAY